MSIETLVVLITTTIAILYGVGIYNGLVTLKHNITKAWANIDVLLNQRHDELPKLVEVAKQYMSYEKDTLERVIQARSAVFTANQNGDVKNVGVAESALRQGLGSLFALAENYPELKADENFQHLRDRITGLENAIADRRELYNESVNLNNVRIEQFPDLLLARWFKFLPATLLEITESDKQDVDLKALFS